MKTKKIKCDCGDVGCAGLMRLMGYKSNQNKNKKAVIEINNSPMVFSLYKLFRIRDWINNAIIEIGMQEVKEQMKKDKKHNEAVKSVAKK